MSATITGKRNRNYLNDAFLFVSSRTLTVLDLEARYQLPYRTTIAVGANNINDEYPDPTPTIVNTNGPIGFSSFSPFGFSGRFLYARLSHSW